MKSFKTTQVLFGCLAGLAACGGDDADRPETPPPGGAQAAADGGPGEPPPPPLDTTPPEDQLTEKYGLFVTPEGSEEPDGTRAKPFSSIAEAIEKATPSGKRVYVCQGVFAEALVLADAVSVIGGLDCADKAAWKRGSSRTRVDAPTSPAMRAKAITRPTRFEGFEIIAPEGTAESPSSIALIAEEATQLTIANTRLEAKNGLDGADGVAPVQLQPSGEGRGEDAKPGDGPKFPAEYGLLGVPYPTASVGGTRTCQGAPGHDPEAGGASGRGGAYKCSGTLQYYSTNLSVPYERTSPVLRSGAAGAAGADGASATGPGALTPEGYATADGTAGSDGQPGKGGSGGSAQAGLLGTACTSTDKVYVAIGGAGGGAGGCPGLAGTPGKGGGASIAALLFASPGLVFKSTQLLAGNGGKGGKGTLPSQPSAGGQPGTTIPVGGQAAAPGGAGGTGGLSGSGAGGPSYALAQTGGDAQLADGTTWQAGEGGAGVAQIAADGKIIAPSPAGEAKPIKKF